MGKAQGTIDTGFTTKTVQSNMQISTLDEANMIYVHDARSSA